VSTNPISPKVVQNLAQRLCAPFFFNSSAPDVVKSDTHQKCAKVNTIFEPIQICQKIHRIIILSLVRWTNLKGGNILFRQRFKPNM
jgi:hypothetical protein